jgi:hypothetical protein
VKLAARQRRHAITCDRLPATPPSSVPIAKFGTTRSKHFTNFAIDKDTSKALILV